MADFSKNPMRGIIFPRIEDGRRKLFKTKANNLIKNVTSSVKDQCKQ